MTEPMGQPYDGAKTGVVPSLDECKLDATGRQRVADVGRIR